MSRRGFPRGTVSALHEHWEFVPAFLVAARTEAAGRPVSVPSVGRARQSLHFPLLSNVSVNLRRVSGDNAPGIFTGDPRSRSPASASPLKTVDCCCRQPVPFPGLSLCCLLAARGDVTLGRMAENTR
ncbi:guanine nucleotide-binding protein G(I)/G(S)/G(O) subunit gamma-4 isoform X1 [Equus przewalskii]|uniref:Guanine nucleotide-binding protein G(I)/G(S)/G(O) subunit gamma-4 isoform X1 n=1 Tax=Equus przewalskii TaxID=9798 RepID=A0ABM4K8R5_EQUPR